MSEQEVQWGEWEDLLSLGRVKRYGRAVGNRFTQYADASYLNALECEVRDLRAKQVAIDSNGHYCDGMSAAWSDAQAAISEAEALRKKAALCDWLREAP